MVLLNIEWFGIPGLGRRCQQLSSQAGRFVRIHPGCLSLNQAVLPCFAASLCLSLVERGKPGEHHSIGIFGTPPAARLFESFHLHTTSRQPSCVRQLSPLVCIAFFCAPIETKSLHQFLPDGRLAWEDEKEQQTPQHVEGADDPKENCLEGVIVAGAIPIPILYELVKAFKDPRQAKNHEHLSKKDLGKVVLWMWSKKG